MVFIKKTYVEDYIAQDCKELLENLHHQMQDDISLSKFEKKRLQQDLLGCLPGLMFESGSLGRLKQKNDEIVVEIRTLPKTDMSSLTNENDLKKSLCQSIDLIMKGIMTQTD